LPYQSVTEFALIKFGCEIVRNHIDVAIPERTAIFLAVKCMVNPMKATKLLTTFGFKPGMPN
jgi:hypothetical protein